MRAKLITLNRRNRRWLRNNEWRREDSALEARKGYTVICLASDPYGYGPAKIYHGE